MQQFSGFQMPMTAPEPGSLAHPATPIKVEGPTRRLGCLRMAAGSKHMLPLSDEKGQPVADRWGRRVRVLTTAKDRRLYPLAKGFFFCQHERCEGKAWGSEEELLRAHPSQLDMQRGSEVHVIGFFSADPLNPPEKGCKKCEQATKDATVAAKSEAPILRPCAEHSGGIVGLLTPGEPAVIA